jgi:hypothetical protein
MQEAGHQFGPRGGSKCLMIGERGTYLCSKAEKIGQFSGFLKKNLQRVITFHPPNKNASVGAFWKDLTV